MEGNFSEEQKIQILASFLPIIGIFIAVKNPRQEILTGRKIGNFFLFLVIFFWILESSTVSFLAFASIAIYTAILVSTAVFLMTQDKFLELKLYKFIPTYHELEASLHAFIDSSIDFFKVAFGKEKSFTFAQKKAEYTELYSAKIPPETPYWTAPALIGIPVLNLITLPSFFQKKFHEYQGNIAEGFFLTVLFCVIIFFAKNNFLLELLVFPIFTLIAETKTNTNVRAPIVSIARNIFIFAFLTKEKIKNLQETTTENVVKFNDTTKTEAKNKEEIIQKETTEKIDEALKNL